MAYWVYILKNETNSKHYVGQTSDLQRRLKEHNHPTLGKNRYTRKQKGPWCLIHSEKFETRTDAIKRERFFKSVQGREWIKENILQG